jgi:hypothetical protein
MHLAMRATHKSTEHTEVPERGYLWLLLQNLHVTTPALWPVGNAENFTKKQSIFLFASSQSISFRIRVKVAGFVITSVFK